MKIQLLLASLLLLGLGSPSLANDRAAAKPSEAELQQRDNTSLSWGYLSIHQVVAQYLPFWHELCQDELDCRGLQDSLANIGNMGLLDKNLFVERFNSLVIVGESKSEDEAPVLLELSSDSLKALASSRAELRETLAELRQQSLSRLPEGVTPEMFDAQILEELQMLEDRAMSQSVRNNMYTLQTMVETYAVDWGGEYAADLNKLYQEATVNGRDYWKDIRNPVTGKSGLGPEGAMMEFSKYQPGNPAFRGMVLYQSDKSRVRYQIFGVDELGNLLEDKGNKPFVLTNS